ncbi:MAG: DMT family transporter [Mariniblastus sp.]
MEIGALAALIAALLWTCSSMLWARIDLPAGALNLCKNIVGVFLIFAHMTALFFVVDRALFQAPADAWLWLAISGLIGVAIGDTFYFRSLQILGPRRALMMATTAPLFSAVLGFAILQEDLQFFAVVGIIVTILGVLVVISDRKAKKESLNLHPGALRWGVACGIGSSICQAIGAVCAKRGMIGPSGVDICDPVEATFIRLLVSAIASVVIVTVTGKIFSLSKQVFQWDLIKLLVPATALGTWLGIWLSQIAFRFSDVAIAQTLMSTCPLFAIPIVWYFHKQRVTLIAILGTVVAVIGIFMTVYDFDKVPIQLDPPALTTEQLDLIE